ncbi:hypothetical protein P280DRAFT_108022 [Massarina eburnea CBS 473.64]|uniref:Uncharacterized protein n=1 Tax=Massarina eburnea CBS 473.64 TaxID=1395130 RepID=A0A6A6RT13_9PLEO|nr:hypothetical protein P280DRAFT_108022 [Massarina eburnea CBS 473.64]
MQEAAAADETHHAPTYLQPRPAQLCSPSSSPRRPWDCWPSLFAVAIHGAPGYNTVRTVRTVRTALRRRQRSCGELDRRLRLLSALPRPSVSPCLIGSCLQGFFHSTGLISPSPTFHVFLLAFEPRRYASRRARVCTAVHSPTTVRHQGRWLGWPEAAGPASLRRTLARSSKYRSIVSFFNTNPLII